MANVQDLELLSDFGLFDSTGIEKLAALIRNVQMLTGASFRSGGSTGAKRRGRPPGSGKKRGRPAASANGAPAKKRGPRASFTATKDELAKHKAAGMTAKQVADKYGVSMATVNLHLKKHGLTTPRKGKGAKKK